VAPAIEVCVVDPAGLHPQHAERIVVLALRVGRARPLELGQDRVLGGGEQRGLAGQHARHAASQLLVAERPALLDDDVDLEAAVQVHGEQLPVLKGLARLPR
jgi:hypothetical protein